MFVFALNVPLLTTTAGRYPACSCPARGFKFTLIMVPWFYHISLPAGSPHPSFFVCAVRKHPSICPPLVRFDDKIAALHRHFHHVVIIPIQYINDILRNSDALRVTPFLNFYRSGHASHPLYILSIYSTKRRESPNLRFYLFIIQLKSVSCIVCTAPVFARATPSFCFKKFSSSGNMRVA